VADAARAAVLVIGIGNELRQDDAAGVEIARRLRGRARPPEVDVYECQGDATDLLAAWEGREAVVIVDSMRSGAPPGTIRRLDASRDPLPSRLRRSASTHAVALGEAIELGRALDRLPARVVVYAVEGRRFGAGAGLSDEVEAVAAALADAVLGEAGELARRPAPTA
jgi:hydrogenase maturation protease